MDAPTIRAVLSRAPGLNCGRLRSLAAAAGNAVEGVLEAALSGEVELPAATRKYLASPDLVAPAADLEWMSRSGARLILCTDSDYPPQLAAVGAAPAALFVLGRPGALHSQQLAVVGSRNPTPEGRSTAREFAARLAQAHLTITSGLAVGIDAAAHEGALLACGCTVAVYGTGLDQVYPPQHADLASRICGSGALVSAFPPRTPPSRSNFPRRNRLISGLSVGTLVIEAALGSGSLVTAALAVKQGRKLFAVPGSIRNPLKRGCHLLIRRGAQLVQDPAEVLSDLKISLTPEALASTLSAPAARDSLDNEYEMLLDAFGFESATIDSLAGRTGKSCDAVASMLLILELEGRVAPHPGGRYGRIP